MPGWNHFGEVTEADPVEAATSWPSAVPPGLDQQRSQLGKEIIGFVPPGDDGPASRGVGLGQGPAGVVLTVEGLDITVDGGVGGQGHIQLAAEGQEGGHLL